MCIAAVQQPAVQMSKFIANALKKIVHKILAAYPHGIEIALTVCLLPQEQSRQG
jgi:hypothetical protein